MNQLIFTVYDVKAKAYTPPFFIHTQDMAVRGFADAINDQQHAFGKHPEDYTLYKLGTFNDTSAHFNLEKEAVLVTKGLHLVKTRIIPNQVDIDDAQPSKLAQV